MRRTFIACVLVLSGCVQTIAPCDDVEGLDESATISRADACEWYGSIYDAFVEDGVLSTSCPTIDCAGSGNPDDALSYEEVKECARQLSGAGACEAFHEAASNGACASCLAF